MWLPQKPYLPAGSLRDQITYPFKSTDQDTARLHDILRLLEADDILEQHGGLDASKDWNDVLAAGEKQKLGLSRIFWHLPKYAILDEATSSLHEQIEGKI